jgi:predicted P-loop ATPase
VDRIVAEVPLRRLRAWADYYLAHGWRPIPLNGRDAFLKDWPNRKFDGGSFFEGMNLGLASEPGRVDVDCDAPEVVAMAPRFLPPTGAIYGHARKPQSHWWYSCTFPKLVQLKDLACGGENDHKAMMAEIRINHQSMAPPSIHPDHHIPIWWTQPHIILPEVESDALQRKVNLLTTAGLTARYYNPEGNRHDWGLAVSGMCFELGLTEEEMHLVFEEAGKYVQDGKLKDRLGDVRSTYRHGPDDALKGRGALKELMPKGELFVKSLQKIWGNQRFGFKTDSKGVVIAKDDQDNVRLALRRLDANLTLNMFSHKPLVTYNGSTVPLNDAISERLWLEVDSRFKFRPTQGFFETILRDTARQNAYHPVLNYLKGLEWDHEPRIDTWLIRLAGAADTDYVKAVSSLVLIAAVRRVRDPGCKFDELLVLESEQGQLKSSALRMLCPDEDWFSDDLPLNLDAKQIIERTTGKWIIEASELKGLDGKQGEHLKAMLSRQEDGPVRLSYERLADSQPRQFIIVGTTNSHHYLADTTGNRRFWPVRVQRFDLEALRKERDQLWAEAAYREAKGESIRLKSELYAHAALQQERRREIDPWEPILESAFSDRSEDYRLTYDDVYEKLEIPIAHRTEQTQKRVLRIMQGLGFRSMPVHNKKTQKKERGLGRNGGQGALLGVTEDVT